MKRNDWDNVADDYESEIFSVLEHDRKGLVLSKLDQYGKAGKTASDIGCGIGHFIPAMSERFREVLAVDFSARCIARAQEKYSHLTNISYMTADLASPKARLPGVDLALSVNSLLTQSLAQRNRILDVVCGHIRRDGHLVLVVPSIESALLTSVRLIEWNLRSGISPGAATRAGFEADRKTANRRIREGIVQIDGVETKHFLSEELEVLLKTRGMEILDIRKMEYSWKTEFSDPPRWMKDPFPWDWLCVAKKVKGR